MQPLTSRGESALGHGASGGRSFDSRLAIHKFSCNGIGYSVAEWSDVRHVFGVAVPRRGTTLWEQADDALRIIETVNGVHGTQGAIVQQAVLYPTPR
jgi:hypothetical protein